MLIAHFGDTHIRNLKYHREYREVFSNIYEKLKEVKPDIIVQGSQLDIPSNSIDCIILTEVLEHLYEPQKVLKELNRILKPHGKLIGTVPFAQFEHEEPYDYYRYTYFAP